MQEQNERLKTYTVLPGPRMGLVTPEYLEQIASVARQYNVPFLKITGAQRIAFAGHDLEKVDEILRAMGQSSGPKKPPGIHYIQACPGLSWCKYGRQDSLGLGRQIETLFLGRELPAKTKVGISGCQFNCCESFLRDIGVYGTTKGWNLVFGGNGGGAPRIGDVVGEGLNDDEVLGLIERCLAYYKSRARELERTGRLMRRTKLADLQNFLKKE